MFGHTLFCLFVYSLFTTNSSGLPLTAVLGRLGPDCGGCWMLLHSLGWHALLRPLNVCLVGGLAFFFFFFKKKDFLPCDLVWLPFRGVGVVGPARGRVNLRAWDECLQASSHSLSSASSRTILLSLQPGGTAVILPLGGGEPLVPLMGAVMGRPYLFKSPASAILGSSRDSPPVQGC